jgi:hypothetical protein
VQVYQTPRVEPGRFLRRNERPTIGEEPDDWQSGTQLRTGALAGHTEPRR